jgi:hypothetical protein
MNNSRQTIMKFQDQTRIYTLEKCTHFKGKPDLIKTDFLVLDPGNKNFREHRISPSCEGISEAEKQHATEGLLLPCAKDVI